MLDEWFVNPDTGCVKYDGRSIHLEPRVMQLLVFLASRCNRVVSREELLDTVWPDTIVNEDALTRAVSDIRKAFQDDHRQPKIIETVPKRGYRLLVVPVPVEDLPEQASVARVLDAGSAKEPTNGVRSWLDSRLAVVIVGALVLGTIITIGMIVRSPSRLPDTAIGGRPLSSFPGAEYDPAISADGRLVAFLWSQHPGEDAEIYVKSAGVDAPVRLTYGGGYKTCPAWSPDGSSLVFIEYQDERRSLHTVSVVGGETRRLMNLAPGPKGLDWSPDGKWLVYAVFSGRGEASRIEVLELATLAQQTLTSPPSGAVGDKLPAFSIDGESIAFVRTDSAILEDIYLVPSGGGVERRLTTSQIRVYGLDWLPDGERIVFSASPEGISKLWQVSITTKVVGWLPTSSQRAIRPSVAVSDGTLVYENPIVDRDIFEIELFHQGEVVSPAKPLIQSTRADFAGRISPDGSRLAFISDRSGHSEIWIAHRDGSDPWQLSTFGGPIVLAPQWSPDGSEIAVSVKASETFAMFVLDLEGGPPRRSTQGNSHEITTYWSHDGLSVTYETDSSGEWAFERVNVGDGRILRDLPADSRMVRESLDGTRLYYLHGHPCQICSRPIGGGEEIIHLTDDFDLDNEHPYVPVEAGIVYFRSFQDQREMVYQEHGSERPRVLARFDRSDGSYASASPDGRSIIFDNETYESDLVIVESGVVQ